MAIAQGFVYAEEWAVKLQEALDEPNRFKDICRVEYTNIKVLNNPYLTDPTITSLSRGTPYTYDAWNETNETLTVDQAYRAATFIDRANLAQSTFFRQMEAAERQGVLLNKEIEKGVYGDHANWTNFGAGDITGGAVADTATIAVSASNIDDIVRHIERVIVVANGQDVLERNGGFITWRPSDFQELRGFMMANGFNAADEALKGGGRQGVNYMGFTHYSSNSLVANHGFAGVKQLMAVGVLRDTYGQVVLIDDPNLHSGVGIVSRVDYGVKTFTKPKPVLLDLNLA